MTDCDRVRIAFDPVYPVQVCINNDRAVSNTGVTPVFKIIFMLILEFEFLILEK